MPMSQAMWRWQSPLGDAQPAEGARDQIAGVVGDQQKRRFSTLVVHRDRRQLVHRWQFFRQPNHQGTGLLKQPQYLAQKMHVVESLRPQFMSPA